MARLPSLFISHGSPDTAIADTAAARFLKGYAASLPRPKAIVVASAHFEATGFVAASADAEPETIHDFGGFDRALYEIVYPAPGEPELAGRIVKRLTDAGFHARAAHDRGFDHGTWVPLKLMYPDADIPVVQVSVDPTRDADHHLALGEALGALAEEEVLIVGSGSFTHNLGEAFKALRAGDRDAPVPDWVSEFVHWMDEKIKGGELEKLVNWRREAPHAVENHPTPEHLMPLYVALGAAGHEGRSFAAETLHSSREFGVLAMDAYAFH